MPPTNDDGLKEKHNGTSQSGGEGVHLTHIMGKNNPSSLSSAASLLDSEKSATASPIDAGLDGTPTSIFDDDQNKNTASNPNIVAYERPRARYRGRTQSDTYGKSRSPNDADDDDSNGTSLEPPWLNSPGTHSDVSSLESPFPLYSTYSTHSVMPIPASASPDNFWSRALSCAKADQNLFLISSLPLFERADLSSREEEYRLAFRVREHTGSTSIAGPREDGPGKKKTKIRTVHTSEREDAEHRQVARFLSNDTHEQWYSAERRVRNHGNASSSSKGDQQWWVSAEDDVPTTTRARMRLRSSAFMDAPRPYYFSPST